MLPTAELAACSRLFGSLLHERTPIVSHTTVFYSDDVAVCSKRLLLLSLMTSIKDFYSLCPTSNWVFCVATISWVWFTLLIDNFQLSTYTSTEAFLLWMSDFALDTTSLSRWLAPGILELPLKFVIEALIGHPHSFYGMECSLVRISIGFIAMLGGLLMTRLRNLCNPGVILSDLKWWGMAPLLPLSRAWLKWGL